MSKRKNPAAVALGRKGGSVSSKAKTEAARLNGKKGGRPRKIDTVIFEGGIPTTAITDNGERMTSTDGMVWKKVKP